MNETIPIPADLELPVDGCCSPSSVEKLPEPVAGRLVQAFKALGHPVRLQMVHLLARLGGRVCVCDIEAQFELTQPTISHHLRVLREAGLVDFEQRGLYAYYRVQAETMTFLRSRLSEIRP
jgi:ArsR family transcriptional regulator